MYRIIVNPVSGAGRALALLPAVEDELRRRGIEYTVQQTQKRWDAAELAAQAVRESVEAVVAVGGDGTFFEISNGLCQTDTALLFVSCGTGNDFIKTLKLPKDPLQALRAQLDSPFSVVDAASASQYRFLNVAGAGFDVEVLRQTEAYKARFHGILPYLCGLVKTVRTYKPLEGVLEVDGKRVEGRFTILSFANGQYIGGGMRVARKADIRDGVLDVIYVPYLPRFRVCLLLPWFIPGWHDIFAVTHRVQAKSASLCCKGMTVNLDGELRQMDSVRFACLPGGLRVALPANAEK